MAKDKEHAFYFEHCSGKFQEQNESRAQVREEMRKENEELREDIKDLTAAVNKVIGSLDNGLFSQVTKIHTMLVDHIQDDTNRRRWGVGLLVGTTVAVAGVIVAAIAIL